MDMMERHRMLMDFRQHMNEYSTIGVKPVNANYSVELGSNSVKIIKNNSTSSPYGRAKQSISGLALVSGKTYTLTATISGFSRSGLTGFVYIADSGSNIIAQTEQINSLTVGDTLSMTFTYNPGTMTELSFYMNRGFNVNSDTYIQYSDITILAN